MYNLYSVKKKNQINAGFPLEPNPKEHKICIKFVSFKFPV